MLTDTAPYRYPHYHTLQDTPDNVDYERLARVVTGLHGMLRDLAHAPAGGEFKLTAAYVSSVPTTESDASRYFCAP